MLDPESFKSDNIRWRFHTTNRLGQFDIAVPSDDDFNPHPDAISHLQSALDSIDDLYDAALAEAEKGWTTRYNAPLRPREAGVSSASSLMRPAGSCSSFTKTTSTLLRLGSGLRRRPDNARPAAPYGSG